MKGGWNQKHVHPVSDKDDGELPIGDAPDKSDDRMPVLNR